MTRPGTPLAVFAAGSERPGEIAVTATVARIGQGGQNDIVIDDDTVSTSHALLEYSAGSWRLTDLGSRNGTFLNGTRLTANVAAPLEDRAEVAFGLYRSTFMVRSDVTPPIEAPPRSQTPPPSTLADRAGFRLPLWIVVLVLLILAIAVGMVVMADRAPNEAEPVGQPVTELLPHLVQIAA